MTQKTIQKKNSGEQMQINIKHIGDEGLSVKFTKDADFFPVLNELRKKDDHTFTSPLTADLFLIYSRDKRIIVSGKIQTSIKTSCDRCLEKFDHTLITDFKLFFSDAPPSTDDEDAYSEDGYEIRVDSVDTEFYTGDIIQLKNAIQEQVLLSLPNRAVCNSECKGLCQKCGVNLNEKDCQCDRDVGHPAFAALKALKKD